VNSKAGASVKHFVERAVETHRSSKISLHESGRAKMSAHSAGSAARFDFRFTITACHRTLVPAHHFA
jgi:hypothetical protein